MSVFPSGAGGAVGKGAGSRIHRPDEEEAVHRPDGEADFEAALGSNCCRFLSSISFCASFTTCKLCPTTHEHLRLRRTITMASQYGLCKNHMTRRTAMTTARWAPARQWTRTLLLARCKHLPNAREEILKHRQAAPFLQRNNEHSVEKGEEEVTETLKGNAELQTKTEDKTVACGSGDSYLQQLWTSAIAEHKKQTMAGKTRLERDRKTKS